MTTPHPPSAPSPLTRGEGYPIYDLARAALEVAFSLSQPHRDGEKVPQADEGRAREACHSKRLTLGMTDGTSNARAMTSGSFHPSLFTLHPSKLRRGPKRDLGHVVDQVEGVDRF